MSILIENSYTIFFQFFLELIITVIRSHSFINYGSRGGEGLENKDKLILTEIFPSVQKHYIIKNISWQKYQNYVILGYKFGDMN